MEDFTPKKSCLTPQHGSIARFLPGFALTAVTLPKRLVVNQAGLIFIWLFLAASMFSGTTKRSLPFAVDRVACLGKSLSLEK